MSEKWHLAEIARCEERAQAYAERAASAKATRYETIVIECLALAELWRTKADAARAALDDWRRDYGGGTQ